jgi:hypothetical protein
VEAHPQISVINTARMGARINGAAYAPYDALLQKIPASSVNVFDRLDAAFERAPERKFSPDAWLEALGPTREFAQKLYVQALSAAAALEALPEKFYQPVYRESREIKEIYAMAIGVNALLDKSPEDYKIILEGRLKKSLLDFQRATGTLETNNPFGFQLRKNREFFWALAEGVEPTLAFLEAALKTSAESA